MAALPALASSKQIQHQPDNPLPRRDDERNAKQAATDLLSDWQDEFNVDREESSKWRRLRREWENFEAGRQWSEPDLAYLKEKDRPPVTVNLVRPIVTMVRGQELQAREDIVAFGREEGDARVSEVATAGLDYVRDSCDASFQWSEAFGYMLVQGMGWIGTRIDYDVNPKGHLIDEALEPSSMYWDYAARMRNLADARRLWQVKIMDVAAARLMAGTDEDGQPYEVSDLDAAWTQVELPSQISRETRAQRDYRGHRSNSRPGMRQVRLVERQWWELETFYLVTDPRDGAELELSADELAEFGVHGFVSGSFKKRVWKKALIGSKILWQEDLGTDDPHFQCITGVRDDIEGYWRGMIPDMMDAQRWVNNWLAMTIHIYKTSGKGGLEFETGAFADPDRAIRDWAKSSAAIEYNPGALAGGQAREKATGQLPAGFEAMIPLLIDLVRQSAGVNPELLGMTPGTYAQDPSGVLDMQRQKAGLTMLAQYFDSMALFRRMHGRLHLGLIKEFMSDGRLVRIVGESGAKYVPLFLENEADDFDLITEGVPTSPNNRERNWRLMQPILPLMAQMPDMPPEMWVEVARASPLPPQFAEKLAEHLKKQQEPDPEMLEKQKKEEELRIRAIVAAIIKDEGAAHKSEAGAVLDLAKAQATKAEVQLKAGEAVFKGAEAMKDPKIDPNKQAELESREREGAAGREATASESARSRAFEAREGDETRRFQAQEGAASRYAAERQAKMKASQPKASK